MPGYKCPYCETKFVKQRDCVTHVRECGSRIRNTDPAPPDADPKVPWELNHNDRNLLKGLRISDQ